MQKNISYTEINSEMWNEWASSGGGWSLATTYDDFIKATQGIFDICRLQ